MDLRIIRSLSPEAALNLAKYHKRIADALFEHIQYQEKVDNQEEQRRIKLEWLAQSEQRVLERVKKGEDIQRAIEEVAYEMNIEIYCVEARYKSLLKRMKWEQERPLKDEIAKLLLSGKDLKVIAKIMKLRPQRTYNLIPWELKIKLRLPRHFTEYQEEIAKTKTPAAAAKNHMPRPLPGGIGGPYISP